MSTEQEVDQTDSRVVAAAKSGATDSSPPSPSPWEKVLSKLHWRAHCLLPDLIRHPAGLRVDAARDQKENENSRVAPDAGLRAPMIWGVEFYGPAEIGHLYEGLARLGWKRAGGWKAEHDAAHRVRAMRSHGAGAWTNLGSVRRRGDTSLRTDLNFAPLPDGIESLTVVASQVTASLTALVIGFELRDALAGCYEAEINKDRRTRHKRVHRSWTVEWVEPGHQKKHAVAAARGARRSMVGAWFARHFPGYFCGLNLRERFPTMELLVARGLASNGEDGSSDRHYYDWRWLLMEASPYEQWRSSNEPGLQLSLESGWDEDRGLHIYITLDPSVFPDKALEGYGGSGLQAYSWYCDLRFTRLFVHFSTIQFLRVHTQELHVARERLKIARSKSRNVPRTLDEIGGFFDRTLGSPATFRELSALSEHPIVFRRSCGDFYSQPWPDEEPQMLHAAIESGVRERSVRLTEDEASLRTHFEQLTTVLSIRESIRLQRRTLLLTFIALTVALASLLIAIYGPARLT